MIKELKNQKGMSLVETLVGIAIFAIAAVIAVNILVSIVNTEKKSSVQNAIYEDMRAIMNQLTTEIQNGSIDYEEYYSVCVLQDGCGFGSQSDKVYYGVAHGVYGGRFFDPGLSTDGNPTLNPDDLGVECTFPDPYDPTSEECDNIYTLSSDLNTGQNPFKKSGNNPDDANAFCEKKLGLNSASCDQIDSDNSVVVDQLFLIDKTGTKKTILAKKMVADNDLDSNDYAIGKVVMNGTDEDQNGLVDTFSCDDDFTCNNDPQKLKDFMLHLGAFTPDIPTYIQKNEFSLPNQGDLAIPFDAANLATSQFIPITPLRSSVIDLKFIISPLEDPYKAFTEKKMQTHPVVTIILTLGLSKETQALYPGDFNPITVQTTVAAGVVKRIETYPPVTTIKEQGAASWMKDFY